jgi:glycosyltransferase involved in cell wall biosynthesis
MNIGIMVSSQTPEAGGGYTFEDDILQAFFRLRSESKHDFFLVGYAPERPRHLDHTGLPWLSLHQPRELRRKLKFARLLQRLKLVKKKRKRLDYEAYPGLQKQPPDLMCYLTPMIRPVADIPYITNVWDVEHRQQPFFPEVSAQGEWESRERRCREIFSRAAYILTPNRRGKEEIISFYGVAPERVRTLAHATPAFALQEGAGTPGKKSLEHLGVKGDYLFYPAQFWPHKNHVVLLLALRCLKEQHGYQPQLVLCGSDKGNRAYIEQCIRDHSLQDQVLIPGFVSREDLITLYRQAAALVYPSFCGPENLPPLEAFALGCPVIASSIPGALEQLGEAALLVDARTPELWAEAIMRLQRDAVLRGEYIAKGKERATRYTADHFVGDLLAIFDEFAPYRRCWP